MQQYFTTEKNMLTFKRRREIVRIEGWGENGLRVRSTENHGFTPHDWVLTEEVSHDARAWVETRPTKYGTDETIAVIENGSIRAEMTPGGRIRFLNGKGEVLLQEHYLSMDHGNGFGG